MKRHEMDTNKRLEALEDNVKGLKAEVVYLRNTMEIIKTAIPTLGSNEMMVDKQLKKRFQGQEVKKQDHPVEIRSCEDNNQGESNAMETPGSISDDDFVEIISKRYLDPMDSEPSSSVANASVFPNVETYGNEEEMDDYDDIIDWELFRPTNPTLALDILINASEEKFNNDSGKMLEELKSVINPSDGTVQEIMTFNDQGEEAANPVDESSKTNIKDEKKHTNSSGNNQEGTTIDGQIQSTSVDQNIQTSPKEFNRSAKQLRIILRKTKSKYDFDLYN